MSRVHVVMLEAWATLLFISPSGWAHEETTAAAVTAPAGPIVIQNLHIESIQNLTIVSGGPAAVGGAIPSAAVLPPGMAPEATTPFKTILVPQADVRDADIAAEDVGLEIHIFALGQADATLIIGPEVDGKRKSLLIDKGEASNFGKNYEQVAERIEELLGEKKVTYFVATHYHFDHVGGKENGIAGLIKKSGVEIETVIG